MDGWGKWHRIPIIICMEEAMALHSIFFDISQFFSQE